MCVYLFVYTVCGGDRWNFKVGKTKKKQREINVLLCCCFDSVYTCTLCVCVCDTPNGGGGGTLMRAIDLKNYYDLKKNAFFDARAWFECGRRQEVSPS